MADFLKLLQLVLLLILDLVIITQGWFMGTKGEHVLHGGETFEAPNKTNEKLEIYCYQGDDKSITALWRTTVLHINISTDDYHLYSGWNVSDVISQHRNHFTSWFNLLPWKTKEVKLPPFNASCVGVFTRWTHTIHIYVKRIDYWRVLIMALGLVMFFSSPNLSKNVIFYYTSGITFGIIASLLIVVFVLSRLVPRRAGAYAVLLGGWSIAVFLLQSLWENLKTVAVYYQAYAVAYIVICGIISFAVCYRLGPLTNPRTVNLITWGMQIVALLLIFFSSSYQEASMAIIIVVVTVYNFPQKWAAKARTYWRKKFPPRIKLLTDDEYYQQASVETRTALNNLRQFCRSPECNAWKTVSRIKSPVRFAAFVEGASHLSDEEVLEYESESSIVPSALLTEDESDSD